MYCGKLKIFVPFADSSDIELRHAIANVVAAVLGSPERTTHLWWHLFSPDKLANTYMTGFLVSVA